MRPSSKRRSRKGTSHSAVSRLEKGTHIPQLLTLQRIAAVLEEELLVCFQRTVDGEAGEPPPFA